MIAKIAQATLKLLKSPAVKKALKEGVTALAVAVGGVITGLASRPKHKDSADDLEKKIEALKKLRKDNIITEEEFQKRLKKLLKKNY